MTDEVGMNDELMVFDKHRKRLEGLFSTNQQPFGHSRMGDLETGNFTFEFSY